jgi:hypothetical protein
MAKARSILKRQLEARAKIWPDITNNMLWDRTERDGFVTLPRAFPLIMNIMDDLSTKVFQVRPILSCGAVSTTNFFSHSIALKNGILRWLHRPKSRSDMERSGKALIDLGFIDIKSGPIGEMSYAVFSTHTTSSTRGLTSKT